MRAYLKDGEIGGGHFDVSVSITPYGMKAKQDRQDKMTTVSV